MNSRKATLCATLTLLLGLSGVRAQLYDSPPCNCTPLYNCEPVKSGAVDPSTLMHCRFNENGIPIVCCPDSSSPDSSPSTTPQGVGSRAKAACEKDTSKRLRPLNWQIYGGSEAELGEFPHIVALGYESENQGETHEWKCGGSLITDRHVLTAAHCVLGRTKPVIARMGTIDVKNATVETLQDRQIARIRSHPAYEGTYKKNDIAVITLDSPVDVSDSQSVYPICLDTRSGPIEENSSTVVAGFGRTEKGSLSNLLLKTNLTVIENGECAKRYKKLGLKPAANGFSDGQFCSFDPGFVNDACQGDSGGPIMQKLEGHFDTLVGVVSFGPTVCAAYIPGVYTRINSYLEWIENEVWSN